MEKNKDLIDFIILKRPVFSFGIRTIFDNEKQFTDLLEYSDPETFDKLVYHNTLVDGVKLKFKYCTLIINARNGY